MIAAFLLPFISFAADPAMTDAALCAGVEPCIVASTADAGVDRKGRPLRIVEIHHAKEPTDGERADPCVPRVWYLVGGDYPRGRLLHQACNDGYGARGMGLDSFSVHPGTAAEPGHVSIGQSGGSAWGWDTSVTIRLDPLFTEDRDSSFWFSLGPQLSTDHLDRHTGARTSSWEHASCDSQGEAGPGSGNTGGAYHIIPRVEAGMGGDWRSLDISRCAAPIRAAGPKSAARLSVLARGETELIVQITDDTWVDEAATWLMEDHLELWIGEGLPDAHDHACVGETPPPSQWGVRLSPQTQDRVIAAHDDPDVAHIKAEVVAINAHTRRARLVLGEAPRSVTVVFSDSDDGTSQELIATSDLRFGDATSLGSPPEVWRPDTGACVVEERALVWRPAVRDEGKAVSGM